MCIKKKITVASLVENRNIFFKILDIHFSLFIYVLQTFLSSAIDVKKDLLKDYRINPFSQSVVPEGVEIPLFHTVKEIKMPHFSTKKE